jgi:tetratricopeptide (TPR) repeat protein
MRTLIITLTSVLLTTAFSAEVSLDLKAMDATLERIAVHAKNFPPKFSNDAERRQTEKDLKAAIKVLDAAVAQYPDNAELWFQDGYANAMGQHLDIPGCDQQFMKAFERFLKLKPNDRSGNFLYGGFLAGTAALQKESIPYLNKAIELGEMDAHYTLAFVYVCQKNKEQAISHLRAYAKAYPDEAAAVNAKIEGLKEANIRIEHRELPADK